MNPRPPEVRDKSVDGGSLPNPIETGRRIRAVLFDLDGTLYRQGPLRAFMSLELLGLALSSGPRLARQRLRALQAFRNAQERLRPQSHGASATAQLMAAADGAGLPIADVERLVQEWMQERPLKYLSMCRATGLDGLLSLLEQTRVPMGVLSDYPAELKLRALGLADRFSPVLCSTDRDIDALKPNPRGFLRACRFWQLSPRDVLVVGDRVDVDAAGAAAAGMPCVIIGRRSAGHGRRAASRQHLLLPSLERLRHVLDDRH